MVRWAAAFIPFVGALFGLSTGLSCSSSDPVSHPDAGSGDDARSDQFTLAHPPKDAETEALQSDLPVLSELSVKGPSTEFSLFPAFAPSIVDYYIECSAGANKIDVTMTASLGATSTLTQPVKSKSAPHQTLSLTVHENDAIVARAYAGKLHTDYWIRCLPHDFPEMVWTPHREVGEVGPGYYLVGIFAPPPGYGGYAMILDTNGVPIWYAKAPSGDGACAVESLSPGQISFLPYTPPGYGGFLLHDFTAMADQLLAPMGYTLNDHELQLLTNGHYLGIASPFKTGIDLTGLSVILSDGKRSTTTFGADSTILDCSLVEFGSDGTVYSVWNASDHFDPRQSSTYAYSAPGPMSGTLAVDVFHCNSIDVEPSSGNLLVSSRHMDSVFYLDRPSGKVLWKMGGTPASLDGAIHVSVDSPFYRQHDARLRTWEPGCNGGSGVVTLFDDETSAPGKARGMAYDVVVGLGPLPEGGLDAGEGGGPAMDGGLPDGFTEDGGFPDGFTEDGGGPASDGSTPDGGSLDGAFFDGPAADGSFGDGGSSCDGAISGPAGQATTRWEFAGASNSGACGSFRIDTDGTAVIGWGKGYTASPTLMFSEVTSTHEVLLDFSFTDYTGGSYRAIKVPVDQFDKDALRAAAGTAP